MSKRKKYKKTYKIIGEGEVCRKNEKHGQMERRTHKEITDKIKRQAYYFKMWDYCLQCKYIQLYEEEKVWNNTQYSHVLQEEERQQSFLNNI